MNRRYVLSRAVYGMLALVVLAFVWVLFSTTRIELTDEELANDGDTLFADLVSGASRLQRVGGQAVWVTHVSPMQMEQAVGLHEWLMQPLEGCAISTQYCVLSARTQRSGIYVQFTATPPSQLDGNAPWFGGFVDPTTSEIFDLFGRAYKQNATARSSLKQIQ